LVRLYQLDLAELVAYPVAFCSLLPLLLQERPEAFTSLQALLEVWLRAYFPGPLTAAADPEAPGEQQEGGRNEKPSPAADRAT
jgi:hypothetical protein